MAKLNHTTTPSDGQTLTYCEAVKVSFFVKEKQLTQYIDGYVYGGYSVAPSLTIRGFTSAAWSLRDTACGITIAAFTSQHVAIKFMCWLWDSYGDVTEILSRVDNLTMDEHDFQIAQAIYTRARHETYIDTERKGLPYKPYEGEVR